MFHISEGETFIAGKNARRKVIQLGLKIMDLREFKEQGYIIIDDFRKAISIKPIV